MAEIPVHEKSGFPWWGWLILLLLLGLVIWFIAGMLDNDDDTVVANDTTAVEQPYVEEPVAAVDTGAITTMAALTGAGVLTNEIGRQVNLQGVPVESLAGDMAFYVGDSPANRTLVVFNETPTPGTMKEGKIDVNPGSMVSLQGTVRAASDKPANATVDMPAGVDAYIFADSVDVLK